MNIISVEGDKIIVTITKNGPVVMSITSSRPRGLAIELIMGKSDTVGSLVTRHEKLSARETELAVVNPDLVGFVKSDEVSTPDVLWVDVREMNILDDDVLSSVDNT